MWGLVPPGHLKRVHGLLQVADGTVHHEVLVSVRAASGMTAPTSAHMLVAMLTDDWDHSSPTNGGLYGGSTV